MVTRPRALVTHGTTATPVVAVVRLAFTHLVPFAAYLELAVKP
ncbi:hypothetical protein ACIQ8D_10575 [Streptomyces sp. NPDC096094]